MRRGGDPTPVSDDASAPHATAADAHASDAHASDAHASDPHASDAMTGPHASPDDHGEDHGHDDHAHGAGPALGPVDSAAWAAGLLGLALALAVVYGFASAAGFFG